MKSSFAAVSALVLGLLAVVQDVHAAIMLSPGDAIVNGSTADPPWDGNVNPLSADQVEQILLAELDIEVELTECFKDNVGGSNEGAFADYYDVDWDPDMDPNGGTLSWLGPDAITDALYLGVKDGNNADFYYIFDIDLWGGTEDVELSGFFPELGAISHLSIFCGDGPDMSEAPEASSMLTWVALGVVGLVAMRRRNSAE